MRPTRDTHLHSKEHLLADDLSRALGEPRRFGAYLGIAKRYYESDLRALLRYVLEKKDLSAAARGKYFFGALRRMAPRMDALTKRRHRKPGRKSMGAQKTSLNNSMELSGRKKPVPTKSADAKNPY